LLDHPTLKSLQQRIALRATIQPLNQKESQAYVEHRVALASATGAPLFTPGALKLIIREAKGIPRKLNIICDNALITGYGRQRKPVSISEVKEILADMDASRSSYLLKWAVGVAAAILLAIGTFLFSPNFLPGNGGESSLSPVEPHGADRTELSEKAAPVPDRADEKTGSGFIPEQAKEVVENLKPSGGTAGIQAKPRSRISKGTIAVKEGDNLSQIAQEAYGSSSRQYVEWVRQHNPHIVDPNIILPGQKIVLPEYNKE
jgi:general secretion pathway protein A